MRDILDDEQTIRQNLSACRLWRRRVSTSSRFLYDIPYCQRRRFSHCPGSAPNGAPTRLLPRAAGRSLPQYLRCIVGPIVRVYLKVNPYSGIQEELPMKRRSGFVFAAVLFLFSAAAVFGSPVGSVAGSVKDTSGAMVPRVKLTLVNS